MYKYLSHIIFCNVALVFFKIRTFCGETIFKSCHKPFFDYLILELVEQVFLTSDIPDLAQATSCGQTGKVFAARKNIMSSSCLQLYSSTHWYVNNWTHPCPPSQSWEHPSSACWRTWWPAQQKTVPPRPEESWIQTESCIRTSPHHLWFWTPEPDLTEARSPTACKWVYYCQQEINLRKTVSWQWFKH